MPFCLRFEDFLLLIRARCNDCTLFWVITTGCHFRWPPLVFFWHLFPFSSKRSNPNFDVTAIGFGPHLKNNMESKLTPTEQGSPAKAFPWS
jgi:hypothetical protein